MGGGGYSGGPKLLCSIIAVYVVPANFLAESKH